MEKSGVQFAKSTRQPYDDEVHLRAIRKALESGNAAVMVGSGFSRNADGGANVGTWDDLARALAKGLTPQSEYNSAVAFNAANATQLAEQYERLFSRPALEQLLKEVVPDERLTPGGLHESLLSLPWSEVFTTNYDTLLERTSERLLDSSYLTVCCREDIPQSKVIGRRRIVKLHGSFASQRPFVITEEDYRTYPERFAPFVNLVRQALLENVLCLIGFSGDDPNFLHWIGWVRDMLDTHALPVYLFLSSAPSLGQRRLLQARGVTPVILPPSDSGEASDYSGRYRRLFDDLSKPLDGNPIKWGNVNWATEPDTQPDDPRTKFEKWQSNISALATHRSTYPGWLIAPDDVRARFAYSVQRLEPDYSDPEQRDLLRNSHASIALAALDTYAWYKSVVLQDLFDEVAELGIEVLLAAKNLSFSNLSSTQAAQLSKFRLTSQRDIYAAWNNLGVSLLIWARQSDRAEQYQKIRTLLKDQRGNDPNIQDSLEYHDILLAICRGNRSEARYRLAKWSVRGSDPYTEIRRAMLVAELGNSVSAFTSCQRAVLTLRRQQRHKPDDPLLLSMESWGCFMAAQLSRSLEASQFRSSSAGQPESAPDIDQDLDSPEPEGTSSIGHIASPASGPQSGRASQIKPFSEMRQEFDLRLKALGTRGYSSSALLDAASAQLNAEVGISLERESSHWTFDLGVRRRHGLSFGPRGPIEKIDAAMAWLQLAERVGLPPTLDRIDFLSDEFLQAAWWTRFFDPLTRRLGILLRCGNDDVLKSRDDSIPRHRSGWLSRSEVAALSASHANLLAETLLKQIEQNFLSSQKPKYFQQTLAFFTNIFGRIAVRVTDEQTLMELGRRLVALHSSSTAQATKESWPHLTRALARCISALGPENQRAMLIDSLRLPIKAEGVVASPQEANDWINCITLFNACDVGAKKSTTANLDGEVRTWLASLNVDTSDDEARLLLRRLYVADRLALISKPLRERVANYIWRHGIDSGWPKIPGFQSSAALEWPVPHGQRLAERLADLLLNQELRPFSSGGYMTLTLRENSWNLPADRSHLEAIRRLITQYHLNGEYLAKFADQIAEWIESDCPKLTESLKHDRGEFSDLTQATSELLSAVDEVMAEIFLRLDAESRTKLRLFRRRSFELISICEPLGAQFIRFKFLEASKGPGVRNAPLLRSILRGLSSPSDDAKSEVASALTWIFQHRTGRGTALARSCLNVVAIAATSMEERSLNWALATLSTLDRDAWNSLATLETIAVIDQLLANKFTTLEYPNHFDIQDSSTDILPVLRMRCTQIAISIREVDQINTSGALAWINRAAADPLPEVRLAKARKTVE